MRRYNRIVNQNKKSRIKLYFLLISLLVILLVSYLVINIFLTDKFTFVNKNENGDVEVLVVDTGENNSIKYVFDGSTEVEASGGYGNYKLSSLWKLSEKDKNEGKLVADTMRKNYALPIFLWKNERKSNLTYYQRTRLKFVKFEERKFVPSEVINFRDLYFSENIKSVEVIDMSGEVGLIDFVSKIIEVMGGKITLNSKGYDKDLDCIMSSKNEKLIKYANKIFECKIEDAGNISVDLSIKLGAKFAERF